MHSSEVRSFSSRRLSVAGGVLFLFIGITEGLDASGSSALADYVAQSDDCFSWKQVERREADGFAAVRLECASQTWRSLPWQHQILVVRPPKIRNPAVAFFTIGGDGDVEHQFGLLKTVAARGGAIAAAINRVPNQPFFDGRKEDALIAYTFDQYLKTGDMSWPLLFPMVKSAVRGMDAVQAFTHKEFGMKIEGFVVSGASKRGWTTWLVAAVDPRVKAIVPMVIDMLNLKAQTQWAAKIYGRQSERIRAYTELHLIERMDEPRMIELRNWVDPYSYRARFTMPKLLLLGTNDPYWVVDALRNYWSGLPEPKLVFQTPNAGHDLGGGRQATQTLAAFFQMIADREPLPQMTWAIEPVSTNAITIGVVLDRPAKGFRLWTALSADRDFRKEKWSSAELASNPGTQVSVTVEKPERGFRACLVEAELKSLTGQNYKLSTEARVIPDSGPADRGGDAARER